MNLRCLGSSSKGNSYLLTKEDFALVIECGVPFKEVKKALGFSIHHIEACFLTHLHGDHGKYVGEYLKAGIKVYAHPKVVAESNIVSYNWRPMTIQKQITLISGTRILPFEVVHDVPCFGYLFEMPGGNRFPFITDTHYSPFTFPDMTNIIIECNHSQAILKQRLESGKLQKFLHDRIIKSHMSMETCLKFLQANDLTKVNNIVLVHLSDSNSDAEHFKTTVENLTGKRVHIADKGMNINFDKIGF